MSESETQNNLTAWNFRAAYDIIEKTLKQGNLDQAFAKCNQGIEEAKDLKNIRWVNKFESIKQEIINLRKKDESMDSIKKKIMLPRLEEKEESSKINDTHILEKGASTIEQEENPNHELRMVNGIGDTAELKLNEAGISSIKQLAALTPEELALIKGFGVSSGRRIINAAKEYLEHQNKTHEFKEKKNYPGGPMFDPKYRIDRSSKSIASSRIRQDEIVEQIKEEDFEIEDLDEEIDEQTGVEIDEDIDVQTGGKMGEETDEEAELYSADTTEITSENIPSIEFEESSEELELNSNTNEEGETGRDVKPQIIPMKPPQESEITKNQVINGFLDDTPEIPQKNTTEIRYEQVMHEIKHDFSDEILPKNHVTQMLKKVQEIFQSLQYSIVPKTLSIFGKINHIIDSIAIKVLSGSNDTELILISPIKICDLKGTLLVSDDTLAYHSESTPKLQVKSKMLLLRSVMKDFKDIQSKLFDNIISDERIITFFRKYLKKRNIRLEKGRNNQALFFREGLLQYKILVEPLVVCRSLPSSLEKDVLFPYQKSTNIHYIDSTKLSSLITFTELKYQSLESYCIEGNAVKLYFEAKLKFVKDLQSYSLPFVFFGLIFLLIVILQGGFLINTFIGLGSAAICVYGVLLGYLYIKFTKIKTDISKDFSSPYHLGKVAIDDTELLLINKDLPSEQMDQFIYECFGKEADFAIMSKIEEDKYSHSIAAQKKDRRFSKIPLEHSFKGKNTLTKDNEYSKYGSFLEDQ